MDLSDDQWAVLDPLFRPRRRSDGRADLGATHAP
jgi:hypothetical protein